MPRFRKWLTGIRGFEPRFSVRGPLQRDRVFLAQDNQFRYVSTQSRAFPTSPTIRSDELRFVHPHRCHVSPRHAFGGAVIAFPREVDRATMNTFRPPERTPDFQQNGCRWACRSSCLSRRMPCWRARWRFDGSRWRCTPAACEPMVYAPDTQRGAFFNDQERDVRSVQWVEALSFSVDTWRGQHVFKFGTDLQGSMLNGFSESRPVEILRLDGSLAERIAFEARRDAGRARHRVCGLRAGPMARRLALDA